MGSLVGGWDSRAPGTVPKGFEDYKEPYAPRGPRRTVGPMAAGEPAAMSGGLDKAGGGPPSLARTSAPAMHGASTLQRYLSRASGNQGSMPVPSMPREPGSPRTGSPRPGSPRGLCKTLSLKLGDDDAQESPLSAKERWCSRVESASLNLRPDVEDQEEWRHGSFKLADPCHWQQYTASPTQQEVVVQTDPTGDAEQAAQPATPASRPHVTVSRLT